jgi:acyl-CoA thioester hydrolase
MTKFTYETKVPVRFRDIDVAGWVHNSVHLVYAEEARIGYHREVLDTEIEDTPGAVASQEIEYAVPIRLDEEVTVRYRISAVGNSSLTMEFEVRAGEDLAAEGEVTHVLLDKNGEPRDVPAAWRERIRAFEDAPVEGL